MRKKSQMMHIQHHQKQRCKTSVHVEDKALAYTDKYKYLGYTIQEYLNHTPTIEVLTSAASRLFGRVVNLFKCLKNMGIKTFDMLYRTYVTTIANCGCAVWGFHEANDPQVLQNRVCRYYLGVHKFTLVAATQIIMDWPDMKTLRWVEILRYKNRLCDMNPDRLPVKLYKLEK